MRETTKEAQGFVRLVDYMGGDLKFQSKTNKQGRAEELPPELAQAVLELLKHDAQNAFYNYKALLGEHHSTVYAEHSRHIEPIQADELKAGGGLAKESARMGLPSRVKNSSFCRRCCERGSRR